MARWVLYCPNCDKEFTHSQIPVSVSFIDDLYTSIVKPEFPAGGLAVVCSNCMGTSIYQRYQLIYQLA